MSVAIRADDPGSVGQGRVETYAPLIARSGSLPLSFSFLSVRLMKRCGVDAATAAGLSSFPGRSEADHSRDARVAVSPPFTEG